MYHLLRHPIVLTFTAGLLMQLSASGQSYMKVLHREERDNKPYYFGLTLGGANTFLHPSRSEVFLASDSILVAEPGRGPGYSLRLAGTLRLSDRFELRFNPGLILGVDRSFTYTLGSRQPFENEIEQKIIQSNLATLPLHFKFNSDRINNFKVYMLAGVKYDVDLASNARARNADDLVKLRSTDFGAEFGIGFNFFLPFVTVSPEIKFSNGLRNLHARDINNNFSSALDRLTSRMIQFSIHLEE